jgi:hypothetical protein
VNPLTIWSSKIQTQTGIKASELEELYKLLLSQINKRTFENKLAAHPELWIKK